MQLDKVKEHPDVETCLIEKEEERTPSPVKEETPSEEERSTVKHASLSTGELIDLGFDVRFDKRA